MLCRRAAPTPLCWDKSWLRLEALLYGCFWPKSGCINSPMACGTGIGPESSWMLGERMGRSWGPARKMAVKMQLVSVGNFL